MSLSAYLQNSQRLAAIRGKEPSAVRAHIMRLGEEWYREHPEENELIAQNLRDLALPADEQTVARVRAHIILHYFEKLLPLCGDPGYYHRFLAERVDGGEVAERLGEATGAGRGVLLAMPHFGAVELIAPLLAMRMLPVTAVLRFKTAALSHMAHDHVRRMADSGLFSRIRFIEIGKPGTNAALDMAAVLRRGEILLSVFDEKTDYSVPVTLMGRRVWGGAGLDKLMKFAGASIDIYGAFMLRREQERYSLHLRPVDPRGDNPVQQLYDELERMLENHLEQWYFLHEQIPFVE